MCATLGSFEGRETAAVSRGEEKGGGELEGQASASRPTSTTTTTAAAQSYLQFCKNTLLKNPPTNQEANNRPAPGQRDI